MNNEENERLKLAARFINQTGSNVFLTGKAGTGKTTFLREIVQQTHKRALIAAPTGIAAINAGGVTLHSLLQLPFGSFIPKKGQTLLHPSLKISDPDSIIKNLQMREQKRSLIRQTELLIIDEVSMLRADLLDAIETVLRFVRRNSSAPFGGLQILFIGDLLQLPPVVKDEEWTVLRDYYPNMWFFNAHALRQNQPYYLELETVYRQSDQRFITLLNNLRNNTVTPDDIALLRSRFHPDFVIPENEDYITLTTHNAIADTINQNHLKSLKGKQWTYTAKIEGEFSEYAYPMEQALHLKEGAQIMFIKNDPSGLRQFFNGRIGYISSLSDDEIIVGFSDGSRDVKVEAYEWQNMRYALNQDNEIEEIVLGTFTQYPLKLAWAVTIHKSQGLTFEKAVVDIGNAFAPGQIYVALSRLRSLNGLIMKSPLNPALLGVDNSVKTYAESGESIEVLKEKAEKDAYAYLKEYLHTAYNLNYLRRLFKKHAESYYKDEALSARQKYQRQASLISEEIIPLQEVADKFLKQIDYILQQPRDQALEVLSVRVKAANEYFLSMLRNAAAGLFKLMTSVKENEKKAKTYMEELLFLEGEIFEQQKTMKKAELQVSVFSKGEEFSKESLSQVIKDSWRDARITELQFTFYKGVSKPKKEKAPKGSSRKLSLELLRAGYSLEDIAMERSLTLGTIESHLAWFVRRGELAPDELIDKDKLANILSVIKIARSFSANEIRKHLGDDYTWGEIRIALAYAESMKEI